MSSILVPAIHTGRRLVTLIAASLVLVAVLTVAAVRLADHNTASSPSNLTRFAPTAAFDFCLRGRPC